jgi:thiamine transporter ThiT
MKHLFSKRHLNSLKIALVVGTILCAINQYHLLYSEHILWMDYVRVLLNYVVPFSVASYSSYQQKKLMKSHEKDRPGPS